MKGWLSRKLHSAGGYSLLLTILLIAVFVMLAIVLIPRLSHYKETADNYGCKVALKKTQDMLDVEYLGNYGLTLEEADVVIHRAMWEQDWLCPSGGDYFVVEDRNSEQPYRVTCGLHEDDTALRTRLNAERALALVQQELEYSEAVPDAVRMELNSTEYFAERVDTEPPIKRGTRLTSGYDGIVLFYIADAVEELRFFCYADENHCAIWRVGETWAIK